jgi:hypothetical protein
MIEIHDLLGELFLKFLKDIEWFEVTLVRLAFEFGDCVIQEHLDRVQSTSCCRGLSDTLPG